MEQQQHFLAFPFPAPGHFNPFLRLSTRLASSRVFITLVTTHSLLESHHLSPSSPPHNMRFLTIPSHHPGPLTVKQLLQLLEKFHGMLEDLILSSRSTSSPISCFIADILCPWTQALADKVGIPRVLFWTSGAASLHIGLLLAAGKLQAKEITKGAGTDDSLTLPGLSNVLKSDLALCGLGEPDLVDFMTLPLVGSGNTACVLLNSFEKLEGPLLSAMVWDIPIRCVGPLLPPVFLSDERSMQQTAIGEALSKEEVDCLTWLEKQSPRSVIYISFGSVGTLPPSHMEELLLGVEASHQPFLCVIRLNTEKQSQLPIGFVERTKDRGLIVPWASQLHVLSHPGIAGFVTHCGWNSVVESIAMGVPMLCYPTFGEQPLNALLVVKEWKVGLRIGEDGEREEEDGMVKRVVVERAIRRLMDTKEGQEVRDKVEQLRDAGRGAVKDGGASKLNIEGFVEEIKWYTKKHHGEEEKRAVAS